MNDVNRLIVKKLLEIKGPTSRDLSTVKRAVSKAEKISCPSNIALLQSYHNLCSEKRTKPNKKIEQLLKTRPVRSLSGVVNVSVLTKPYRCPGKCLYCPSVADMPKSYLHGEPAAERASRLGFDPYLQIQKRIEVLQASGHPTGKLEVRVIGGTWSAYEEKYKIWFVKKCFEAANGQKNLKENYRISSLSTLKMGLKKSQKKNETAEHRIVGLSFETRPDCINLEESLEMKNFGATKIELGVQSIYDDVLRLNHRGHGVAETIAATSLLRNLGFKIAYQMMLNLPGSNPKRDVIMFEKLFSDPAFKPDYIKIYPCALVKEAPLYKKYLAGQFEPYDENTLVETIKSIKKIVPRYVRIERIIRDIPSGLIVAGGAKVSNLRQIIDEEVKKEKWHCQCIRCREIKGKESAGSPVMFVDEYEASNGKEYFISFEDKKRSCLYSLLRLRITLGHGNKNTAIVREVHVYGQAADISDNNSRTQHKGLGLKMIKEAERISRKAGCQKIAVISGVGVRDYYRRKLRYKLWSGYMVKNI